MRPLTCREMTELVTEYLEGKLNWRDALCFQLHLSMCRHCHTYLRTMKETVRLLGTLSPTRSRARRRMPDCGGFHEWH